MIKRKKPDIIWVDGMPCINLDGEGIGSRPFPQPIPFEFVQFDIFFPIRNNFTDLQNLKERENLQDILKELEKIFKGE